MVRYKPAHKTETRQRIVDTAAEQFRRHGFDGVGIDKIMAAAGLTRGGFYAHFPSKAALFATIMQENHDFCRRMRARKGNNAAQLTAEAIALVHGYLAAENRERVGYGCSMAALAGDVARADAGAKDAFGEALNELVQEFARGLRETKATAEEPSAPDARALAAVALCVGGLTLARAAGTHPIAAAMTKACRDEAARLLQRG